MAIQTITTLPALAVTVGSAQLRGEIEIQSGLWLYDQGQHEDMWIEGYTDTMGVQVSYTKESDNLKAFIQGMQEYRRGRATWTTSEKVDITSYSKLYVDFKVVNIYGLDVVVGTNNTSAPWEDRYAYVGVTNYSGEREVHALDVSSLSGEFYPRIHMQGNELWTATMHIYRVWLE